MVLPDPNKVIVTGCAGFIGSHLSERLVNDGYEVIGVDCFTENYSRTLKLENMSSLAKMKTFHFLNLDLVRDDLSVLPNVAYVFHLAAQPGVRQSWGESFRVYAERNVIATQRLLERYKASGTKFIVASSSSVYGNAQTLPMNEDHPLRPISPYGVTKKAMESLLYSYHANFGVDITVLRYFTVYGPRQRPDMAFHLFFESVLERNEVTIFGDGTQARDFTFVSDTVEATLLCMSYCKGFDVFNIASGRKVSLNDVIRMMRDVTGQEIQTEQVQSQKGDVKETLADISKAKRVLGYSPVVDIREGLQEQYEWHKEVHKRLEGRFV